MMEGYRLPCLTWLGLLGKSDLFRCVEIQEGLEWGPGWLARWQCHHDLRVDLEEGRQCPVRWTFFGVIDTWGQIS